MAKTSAWLCEKRGNIIESKAMLMAKIIIVISKTNGVVTESQRESAIWRRQA